MFEILLSILKGNEQKVKKCNRLQFLTCNQRQWVKRSFQQKHLQYLFSLEMKFSFILNANPKESPLIHTMFSRAPQQLTLLISKTSCQILLGISKSKITSEGFCHIQNMQKFYFVFQISFVSYLIFYKRNQIFVFLFM